MKAVELVFGAADPEVAVRLGERKTVTVGGTEFEVAPSVSRFSGDGACGVAAMLVYRKGVVQKLE